MARPARKPGPFAAGLLPPETEADRELREAADFQFHYNQVHRDKPPICLDEALAILDGIRAMSAVSARRLAEGGAH